MNYTAKTILSWLGAWLVLSAIGLGLSALGSGPNDIVAGIPGRYRTRNAGWHTWRRVGLSYLAGDSVCLGMLYN